MKKRIISQYICDRGKSALGRIVVLTGARQTGKTTLSKFCFPGYTFLSIEDPVQRPSYLKLTAQQWATLYPRAILDEVQKEPALIESIKSVYDQFPAPRYVLLGSSQLLLMQKVKETLAGRCIIVEIYPLTLPELMTNDPKDNIQASFLKQYIDGETDMFSAYPSSDLDPNFAKRQQVFDYYLKFGGYPALTNPSFTDEDRRDWLYMYVKTFLERDVRDLASFRDLEPFVKLQRYVAETTGELANYSSISKETGVSVPTVQRYIQYLEISYQALVLQPWFSNPLKKLVKSPKIHFMDNGVLKAVLQKQGSLTGNEFESAIVSEIYKQIKSFRLPVNCYHLRTQDGREVDLLLETANYFIAIEIKTTERVNKSDAKHLIGLQDILNKPLKQSFILSNDREMKFFDNNIVAMHIISFLC